IRVASGCRRAEIDEENPLLWHPFNWPGVQRFVKPASGERHGRKMRGCWREGSEFASNKRSGDPRVDGPERNPEGCVALSGSTKLHLTHGKSPRQGFLGLISAKI